MDLQTWWQGALQLVRENETFIEVALFAFAFAESIIFVSVFVPSTAIFIGVGALEGAAEGPLVPLIIAGSLGGIAGGLVSFAILQRLRDDLPNSWTLRDHPGQLERACRFVGRCGAIAVVASKLSGPLRPIVPMLVGASDMNRMRFFFARAASSLIWAMLVSAPAYYGFKAITH